MDTTVIVMLLLGIFTAYAYIAFQSQTNHHAADFKFILFKTTIIVSTMSIGYFSFLLSGNQAKFPIIGSYVAAIQEVVTVPAIRQIVVFVSAVWFVLALSLLPFNHTVYNTLDDSVNAARTAQITTMHRLVYAVPFYIIFVVFSINLFFTLIAVCVRDTENVEWGESDDRRYRKHPVLRKIQSNWKNMNMNVGFFFDRPVSAGEGEG